MVFKIPNHVIALSDYWANFLNDFTPKNRISVLNNPVDCKKFAPTESKVFNEKYFKVLLLGSVGKRKGHYDVLKALPIVLTKFPDVSVIFAGRDETPGATNELKSIAKEKQIDKNVNFIGPVVGHRKNELLHSCSIMTLPSYGENMPISIMEGMAAKLPIIASNVGAIPELLENGKIGILISAGDYTALAHGIIRLIKNPQLAESIASQAYIKINNHYDISKIEEAIEKIYRITMQTKKI
jgi:glycosyltransferase involved in cell wall biosynthesis